MVQGGSSRARAPYLDAVRNVVNYEYCPTVLMAGEGHLELEDLHLPPGLGPSFLSVDGLAGRTLQTSVLRQSRAPQTEPAALSERLAWPLPHSRSPARPPPIPCQHRNPTTSWRDGRHGGEVPGDQHRVGKSGRCTKVFMEEQVSDPTKDPRPSQRLAQAPWLAQGGPGGAAGETTPCPEVCLPVLPTSVHSG